MEKNGLTQKIHVPSPDGDLGLLLTGGEGPDRDTLSRLASWSRWVVAADSGWDLACSAGIAVDLVVGDMDSVHSPLPANGRVVRARRDKAESDTELGLAALARLGARKIILAGGGGGRMDHLLSIRDILADHPAVIRWYTSHDEVFCIRDIFWMPASPGMRVSIFPLGGRCRLESRGLRWPLDGLVLEGGRHSLSNESTGTRVDLRPVEGEALLVKSIVAGNPVDRNEFQPE